MARQQLVSPDPVQAVQNFSLGVMSDLARSMIPDGGVHDAINYNLEQPGRAYKRGGWQNHSAALPAPPTMVGTIHIPTRVVAISNNNLYDVTSESAPQADLVGSVGFSPGENPTYHVGKLILCESQGLARPQKVYVTGALGTPTLAALGGTPPYAAHSTVYAGRIVLARGQDSAPVASDPSMKNRVWFSEVPDVEATWDTANKYLDATFEVTGLAAIQGQLLIFSPRFTERVIGGIPPGEVGENMELQPVGGVGCLDARSIAVIDNQVIVASEEGVFVTNGVGFDNLMEKSDRTGILSFWRDLFVEHEVRSVVGGMLNRNFYFLSSHSTDGSDYVLVCYLPTRTWWRYSNCTTNMFASGATEQETTELYGALHYENYVAKFSSVLKPSWAVRQDGNGVAVTPTIETKGFGQGPGLEAFGFGRLSYLMSVDPDLPAWQASHAYANGDQIFESKAVWQSMSTASSGATKPLFQGLDVSDTLVDGGVTWMNIGPKLDLYQQIGNNGEIESVIFDSPFSPTVGKQRKRFRIFRDSADMYFRFHQRGVSAETEILVLEVESRPYDLAADGESPASVEYP